MKYEKKKGKELILHADPEGYELHAEAVVGPVTLVNGSKEPKPGPENKTSKTAT